MQRPSMTVTTKLGQRYDANHLSFSREPVYKPAEGGGIQMAGSGYVLTFICSGTMTRIPADHVERIEYRETGAQHCGECDGPIWNMVGAGVWANPEPLP